MIQPDRGSLLDINKELAESYKNMEKPERALFYYREAYKIEPEPDLAFHIAALYDYHLNDKKMALHYYQGFLTLLSGKDSVDNQERSNPVEKGLQLTLKDLAKKRIKAINEEEFFKSSIDSIQ
jgi:tetratricopeptide (TPR) repeat protein